MSTVQQASASAPVLERLLDSLAQAVIATDPSGAIIFWNKQAEGLYGWDANEVLGRSVIDVTVPAASSDLAAEIMQGLMAGETWSGEFVVRRKDGSTFLAEVKDVPVLDEAGRLLAIIGLSTDITSRKEEERVKDELVDRLQEALRAKDQFLGLISHELRTPLTVIMGNAQVLQRTLNVEQPQLKEALADIRAEAERLNRVVSNLLVLGKLGYGVPVQLEPTYLRPIIANAIDEHRRRYPARELRFSEEQSLPCLANDFYVSQILSNLLGNAEKYSPRDQPIEVASAIEGTWCNVRVLDRGIGMNSVSQEQLFSPFFRTPEAQATGEGLGIGLAVCKRLIDAQDGKLWAKPRDRLGTEFGFALRVCADTTELSPAVTH